MRGRMFTVTLAAICILAIAVGISWAEDGIGGTVDFNADQKSRLANVEGAVETNQNNIAENASDIAENSQRISTNEIDIEFGKQIVNL